MTNKEGQVQPFWLNTVDGEELFCWHVIPLDVYLENEHELSTASTAREIVDELKGTVGEKLLSMDKQSRVVVNFHGVSLAFFVVSSRFLEYLVVSTLSSCTSSSYSCWLHASSVSPSPPYTIPHAHSTTSPLHSISGVCKPHPIQPPNIPNRTPAT
jgi:hypothetical protein